MYAQLRGMVGEQSYGTIRFEFNKIWLSELFSLSTQDKFCTKISSNLPPPFFAHLDAEFMFYSFVAEFTGQMKTVRMLIFCSIIFSIVKPVPSLPFEAIGHRTAINRLRKSISPGWPFELCSQTKVHYLVHFF